MGWTLRPGHLGRALRSDSAQCNNGIRRYDLVTQPGYPTYFQWEFTIVEGLPQYNPPQGPPTLFGYLQPSNDTRDDTNNAVPLVPEDAQDHPLTDPQAGRTYNESGYGGCPVAAGLQGYSWIGLFPFGAIRYNPTPILGPGENSNWFAWWVIKYHSRCNGSRHSPERSGICGYHLYFPLCSTISASILT